MTQADSVHSTPPTNTSKIEHPVASRRGFLTHAAALAAVGTAIALTPPAGLAEAAITPLAPDLSGHALDLDSFLLEIQSEIYDWRNQWFEVDAEVKIRDRAVKAWEERNPMPGYLLPEDEGYSPTARSDWHARHVNAMQQAKLGPIKCKWNKVAASYGEAVEDFAAIKATNLAELMFKIETGTMMDSADNKIARSVLFDIVRLRRSGHFQYQAATAEVSA